MLRFQVCGATLLKLHVIFTHVLLMLTLHIFCFPASVLGTPLIILDQPAGVDAEVYNASRHNSTSTKERSTSTLTPSHSDAAVPVVNELLPQPNETDDTNPPVVLVKQNVAEVHHSTFVVGHVTAKNGGAVLFVFGS